MDTRLMGFDGQYTEYFSTCICNTANLMDTEEFLGIQKLNEIKTCFMTSGGGGDIYYLKDKANHQIPALLKLPKIHLDDNALQHRIDVCSYIHNLIIKKRTVAKYFIRYTIIPACYYDNKQYLPAEFMELLDGEVISAELLGKCTTNQIWQLSHAFAKMMESFESEEIGISDLSPDNLMVSFNNADTIIKLIDYDELAIKTDSRDSSARISGKIAYRHPKLTSDAKRPLTPGIHNYAALILYLSLIAIARYPDEVHPYLFRNANDDATHPLIFDEEDLADPKASEIFTCLCGADDLHVAYFANALKLYTISGNPNDIPSLSEIGHAYQRTLIHSSRHHDSKAMYQLALNYRHGIFTDENPVAAEFWMKRSAAYQQLESNWTNRRRNRKIMEHAAKKIAKKHIRSSMRSPSYTALINELTYYDGFTQFEAEYGADNCGVNWRKKALHKAKYYYKMNMAYDYQSLVEKLEYDDGFSHTQASRSARDLISRYQKKWENRQHRRKTIAKYF